MKNVLPVIGLLLMLVIGTLIISFEGEALPVPGTGTTARETVATVISSSSTSTTTETDTSTSTLATSTPNNTPTTTSNRNKPIVINNTSPTPQPSNPKPTTPNVVTPPAQVVETPPAPAPAPVPARKLKWGVFPGVNAHNIEDFEDRVDADPDYIATFVHWANNEGKLYSFLKDYVYEKDRTLIIFWEASDYLIGGITQPKYAYRTILAGDHDEYIEDFARQLKNYGGPIILIPFSEWNGDWTPWSGTTNGNTPAEAAAAFRYVHGFFNDAPNVSFGIAWNARSVPNTPENAIENYYPGDAYVDYVGLDGFNMGNPWESFSTIFRPGLNTISKYGKPMLVFSFGSAPGPRKADWLREGLETVMPSYPLMEGFIYFNQNKERNWLLWSDDETFEVFMDYVAE